MPVGAGLATLLVPSAVSQVGWRGAWLLDGCLALGVLLAVARCVPPDGDRRPPRVAGLVDALRSRSVLLLGALFGLYAAQFLALVGLLPAVLVEDGGLGLATAGLVGGLVFLLNAPGNLLGAAVLHHGTPRRRVLLLGSSVMASPCGGARPGTARGAARRLGHGVLLRRRGGSAAIFSGVAAVSAGTSKAGSSMGVLVQGSSIGQLLGPPVVVVAGAAFDTWLARAAVLTGLAVVTALVGLAWPDPEES